MESCNETADTAYQFFARIDDSKWVSGAFHGEQKSIKGSNGEHAFYAAGKSCALGHVADEIAKQEGYTLKSESRVMGSPEGQELTVALEILCEEYETNIPNINDAGDYRYKDDHPKMRILHAMIDARGRYMARFYGELDQMMVEAKAAITAAVEVITGDTLEALLSQDARISEGSVIVIEKDIAVHDLHDEVRVVSGYVERELKSL